MSLFANAKTIAAPAPKAKKSTLETRPLTGMEEYAATIAAIKSLEAIAEAQAAALKEEMTTIFVNEGFETKKKPANFKGTEGIATGSCEMKKRSTSSRLEDEEIALFNTHKLPFEEVVANEEAFIINPAYTNNMELLAKVEEALADVDLPDDFLQKQEKSSKMVVSAETVEKLFTLPNKDDITALMPLVTTLSIKTSVNDENFWGIIDNIMQKKAEADKAAA